MAQLCEAAKKHLSGAVVTLRGLTGR